MLKLDLYHQLNNLVKSKQLTRIKIGYEYFYFSADDKIKEQQTKARQELNPEFEIIPDITVKKREYKSVKEIIDLRELKHGDYILENLEAVRRVKSGWKKTKVARELSKDTETIRRICKRFEKRGVKGLIKERKRGAYKIKHGLVKKILAKLVKDPKKSCEDIAKELRLDGIDISDASVREVLKKLGLDWKGRGHGLHFLGRGHGLHFPI